MNPAVGGNVSVMAFFVSSIPVDQTLNDNGSRIKAWLPGVDWKSTPSTVLASVILLPRDVRSTPWGRSGHSTSIIAIESVFIPLTALILIIMPASTFLTPQGRSWTVSRLYRIRSDGSAVNPVTRLRYN